MGRDEAGPRSCIIIVGEPGSELVQAMVRWAREGEMDSVSCENAYAAVVAVAHRAGRRVALVGHIKELAVENGALFGILRAHAARCCCLLDPSRPVGPQDLLPALRANATLVGAVSEVRAVLKDWFATGAALRTPRTGSGAPHNQPPAREETYGDLRATEAELSALLG